MPASEDVKPDDTIYTWITGDLLSSYISRPVTLVAKFMSIESAGKFMKIQLTNDAVVMTYPVPTGAESYERDSTWLFIKAIVENRNKLKLVSVYSLPEELVAKFDKNVYNDAVKLMVEEAAYLTVDKKDIFEHFGTGAPLGQAGEGLDLVHIDSAGVSAGSASNPNNTTVGADMQFDEFNGSNMW